MGRALGLAASMTMVLVTSTWSSRAAAQETHPFLAQQKRPFIIAHRAGGGLQPENTVEAVRELVRRFPSAVVEVDVRASKDGHLVVIHDDTVDRTTDGHGKVKKLTLAQLKALDAGYCFSPSAPDGTDRKRCRAPTSDPGQFPFRGKGRRIPTLREVLDIVPADAFLSVEVKAKGIEAEVAEMLRSRRMDRLIVGTTRNGRARRLKRALPEAALYAPVLSASCHTVWAAFHLPGKPCAEYDLLAVPDKPLFPVMRLSRYAHVRGMQVASFTVNDREAMRRLIWRGVDAIITDFPDRAQQLLDEMRAQAQLPPPPNPKVPAPPADDKPLRIDAHCHVFNGEDLAMSGFLQTVLMHDRDIKLLRALLPITFPLTQYLFLWADGFRQESRQLDRAIRAAGRLPPDPAKLRAAEATVVDPAPDPASAAGPAALSSDQPPVADAASDAIAQALTEDRELTEELASVLAEDVPDQDKGKYGSKVPLATRAAEITRFALKAIRRFTSPRYINVQELLKLQEDVDLFVPAMVDMDGWLEDSAGTSLPEQVLLMAKLSVLYDGRLLPFVAYNPWRDEKTGGKALAWVQAAIQHYGFVGVKLYPPMGFRPLGNTGQSFDLWRRGISRDFGAEALPGFGERIDRRLRALYQWCADNGVPVMAHVNDSNYSRNGAQHASDPKYWQVVIQDYPKLRLNLGHFGGMDRIEDGGWTRRIIELLQANENVFADLSNFAVWKRVAAADYFRSLAELLGRPGRLHDQLLYGSDWFMDSWHYQKAAYFQTYADVIRGSCQPLDTSFFGGNAVRFLGLRKHEATRQRLDAFYAKHNVPAVWRRKVDRMPTFAPVTQWQCVPPGGANARIDPAGSGASAQQSVAK